MLTIIEKRCIFNCFTSIFPGFESPLEHQKNSLAFRRENFFPVAPGESKFIPGKAPAPRFIRCRPEMLPQPLTLSCESCNLLEASFIL